VLPHNVLPHNVIPHNVLPHNVLLHHVLLHHVLQCATVIEKQDEIVINVSRLPLPSFESLGDVPFCEMLEPERTPLRAPLETGDVNKRKYRPFNRARPSKERRKNPGI